MPTLHSLPRLQTLLLIDAATCAGMGLLLTCLAGPLAGMTAIPVPVLLGAGLALLPVAAFMAILSRAAIVPGWGVLAVVGGNALWVAASLLLPALGLIAPNTFGVGFLLAQAGVVAALATLEWRAARPASRPA